MILITTYKQGKSSFLQKDQPDHENGHEKHKTCSAILRIGGSWKMAKIHMKHQILAWGITGYRIPLL